MAVSDLTVRAARIDEQHAGSSRWPASSTCTRQMPSAQRSTTALDDGATRLVIDLGEVDFIDSVALGVLANAMKRLRAAGGGLAVISGNPADRPRLRDHRPRPAVVIAPTLNEALERL